MISRIALVLIAFVVAHTSAARAETTTSVPSGFQGTWGALDANCGTNLDADRLIVRETTVSTYESDGEVLAAVTRGRFELALVLEMSGEGKAWMTTIMLNLGSNGARLISMGPAGGIGHVWYRCPAKPS